MRTLVIRAAALALLLAGPAAALNPALTPSLGQVVDEARAAFDALTGPESAAGGPSPEDPRLTVPTDGAVLLAQAAIDAADATGLDALKFATAAFQNASRVPSKLVARDLPDEEALNITFHAQALGGRLDGRGAQLVRMGSDETQRAVGRASDEGAVLAERSVAAAAATAPRAQAIVDATMVHAPAAANATTAAALRAVAGLHARPELVTFPLGASLEALQAFGLAQAALAAAHVCADPASLQVEPTCGPDSVLGELARAAAQELALQGVVGAEANNGAAISTAALAAADAYAETVPALATDMAALLQEGLADDTLFVPFGHVAGLSSATTQALLASIEATRSGGVTAVEEAAPVQARVAAARRTAVNTTLQASLAVSDLRADAAELLRAVCRDPADPPSPDGCAQSSAVEDAEAVLRGLERSASLGAGSARARTLGLVDAQAQASLVLADEAYDRISAARLSVAGGASQSVILIPMSDAEAILDSGAAYAQATEARAGTLVPGLASDLSFETGASVDAAQGALGDLVVATTAFAAAAEDSAGRVLAAATA